MRHFFIISMIGGCFVLQATPAAAKSAPDLQAGQEAYVMNCARCHGEHGQGDGPDAARMIPRPRNFTTGTYKFRTTASGTSPTDEDLFKTISFGLAGTRMLGWEGFSEDTRWQLVYYLKSLSAKFTEQLPQPASLGTDPGPKGADLAKGKQLYADLGCAACHGAMGRANGPSAKTLTDDWEQPIRPANLTHGWELRGGSTPNDLVARLAAGMDGTPMPSYADAVPIQDLWQLAYYLQSIQEKPAWGWHVTAARVTSLPAAPTDPVWNTVPRTDVRLWTNQYVNGEVARVMVPWAMIQAVATSDSVAFRISWDDPSEDRGDAADRLALVFMTDEVGWEIGSPQSWPTSGTPPLDVLLWSATEPSAREAVAQSFELPSDAASWPAQAVYEDGRWWLMITRSLAMPGGVTLGAGSPGRHGDRATPMALIAWDGGNQETGRHRAVSAWLEFKHPKEKSHGTH